ncbi:hypothetical protein BDV3_006904 [Batrachochytrium dendrobatidis]|nr:Flavin-linked sulfhydryl oxidase of the mitochondrial IMS [Batrachochytrium dendrobatidis]KAK5665882.1 Flavin-linked sulfhydryl oxidase of the mitochondrial IMS [Batrachochytrium dendrobatidis]OAJ42822.1 hypothetical protein BDEG_26232 [Batrachochytrium dendrobatidis JEL423]
MPAQSAQSVDRPPESCGVCTDFKVLRRKKIPMATPLAQSTAGIAVATSEASASLHTITQQSTENTPYMPFPCPPDSSELGSSTWTFLHTMAAYYPEIPTPEDKTTMRSFIHGLARFYPCWYCASHLQEHIKSNPPQVDSNKDLSVWFCKVHNEVNERQGKPVFDCSTTFARWRTQSKECEQK